MKTPLFFVLMTVCGFVALALFSFFLFGHIEMNNECKFKGPLASVGEGACSKDVNASKYAYEGRYKDDLEFYIPSNYYLVEEAQENQSTEVSFIFSNNPEEAQEGEFSPNLSIIQTRDYMDFDDVICDALLSTSIAQLSPYYDSLENGEAKIENIGGTNACITEWYGELGGIALFQKQYAISHKDSQVVYYFTLTTNQSLDDLSTLEDIVYGLKLR